MLHYDDPQGLCRFATLIYIYVELFLNGYVTFQHDP